MTGAINTFLAAAAVAPPHADLSFVNLFLSAHIVVKMVMTGLLASSVWGWAVIVDKMITFKRSKKEADDFEKAFWSGQHLDELYQQLTQRKNRTLPAVFVAAMREWKRSVEGAKKLPGGVLMRVQRVMDNTITAEIDRLERRLMFLATVGSTAPFVGLFGTVWGIMSSFQSIAASNNTSLAVVAPGIAEALFATALGLLAAIPAVIFYNKFSHEVSRHIARLESFSNEFMAILSRQVDVRSQ
ncbi:MAG: protein TolQ [Hyphomicrobiaceae bacterium]|nr:protein TolQ [Hyphomicrobiaceae bacterium]